MLARISSLLGGWKLYAVVFALGLVAGGWTAWKIASVDQLQTQLEQVENDLAAAQITITTEQAFRREAEVRAMSTQQRLRDYEESLSGLDACRLSGDDVERLRALTR